jgi:hypothetical protein
MTYEMMADTIGADSANIPTTFEKVAGYPLASGDILWTANDFTRFAKESGIVRVSQHIGDDPLEVDAFDIEPGAHTIASFLTAATARQAKGWNSAAYIEASQVGDLVQACRNSRLDKVELWIANWSLNETNAAKLLGTYIGVTDATATLSASPGYQVVAVQWASPTSNPHTVCPGSSKTLKELNVDLSVALSEWFPAPMSTAPTPEPVAPPVTPPVATTQTATLQLTIANAQILITIHSVDGGKSWIAS